MSPFDGCQSTCDQRALCEHGCLGYRERRQLGPCVTVTIGSVTARGDNAKETWARAQEDILANQLTAGRIRLAKERP